MKTVIGAFDTFAHARSAVDALERAGFQERDVSIVANNENNSIDGTRSIEPTTTEHRGHSLGSETATGAMVGGLAGLVLGLAPLVIPGLGAIAAAGWLTMTLTGAAIGAGVGLIGALVGVGVPEEEAHYYTENVRRGGSLVLVRAEDALADDAARVLSSAGAIDIDERAAQYRAEGFVPGAVTPTTTASAYSNTATASTTMPSLSVPPATAAPATMVNARTDEQQMQWGGVRTYNHAQDTLVNENVDLREADIVPGNRDTRGHLEKATDFVTGDTTDDKTGRTVSTDNRDIGQKTTDTVIGTRR